MSEGNIRHIWSETELDDALATLNNDVPAEAELTGARAMLIQAAADSVTERWRGELEEAPAPAKKAGPWRWLAVAAAVAVVSGGLVVARELTSPDGAAQVVAPAVSGSRPHDPLGALTGVDVVVPAGQYRLIVETTWSTLHGTGSQGPVSVSYEQKILLWIPADPTGVWRQRTVTTGKVRWLLGSDTAAKAADVVVPPARSDEISSAGGVFLSPGGPPTSVWQKLTPAFLASLPTDPDLLLRQLRADAAAVDIDKPMSIAGKIFFMGKKVLSENVASAALRVAFVKALARVSGIELSGDGKKEVVLGSDFGDQREELVIDPATATLIGARGLATKEAAPAFQAAKVNFESTYLTTVVPTNGVVPTTTNRPENSSQDRPPPPMATTTR